MDLLAVVPEWIAVAAVAALSLLLAVQLRMAKRQQATDEARERLEKAQRDAALDARSRIEELARDAERIDPRLIEVSARLDAVEERLRLALEPLETVARERAEAAEGLRALEARLAALEAGQARVGEEAREGLGSLRTALDERLAAEAERVGALAMRVRDLEALHARLVGAKPPGGAGGTPAPADPRLARAATPEPAAPRRRARAFLLVVVVLAAVLLIVGIS